jgi:hypothetical protein
MFDSNNNAQLETTEQEDKASAANTPVEVPQIIPAPPLNDAMAASLEEPSLPPSQPVPSIIKDGNQGKDDSDTDSSDTKSSEDASIETDDLLSIKQQALQSLTPLIDKLDQTPEEKFKTTMMLIQASDNSSLIKDAYKAASAITDEKTRAQALLDIVNEINYFTQKHDEAAGQ